MGSIFLVLLCYVSVAAAAGQKQTACASIKAFGAKAVKDYQILLLPPEFFTLPATSLLAELDALRNEAKSKAKDHLRADITYKVSLIRQIGSNFVEVSSPKLVLDKSGLELFFRDSDSDEHLCPMNLASGFFDCDRAIQYLLNSIAVVWLYSTAVYESEITFCLPEFAQV